MGTRLILAAGTRAILKRQTVLFLFLLVFFCQQAQAEEISLTIDSAVAIGLRENRDVLLKAEDVKKAKAKISESEAAMFPSLNFTASRAETFDLYSKGVPVTSTQTTLKQYLYKGGKTMNSIGRDKYALTVKEALLDKAKLELALNIKKAFYTLLLADDFAKLNKAIMENTSQHLETEKARYAKGQAPQQEVLKLSASLSNIKEAYELSLNETDSGRALLNNLLNLDEAVNIIPEGGFEYSPIELELDKAFLKAISMRPEMRQYIAQENADKKSIEVAKSEGRPNIYGSWDYYSRSTTSLSFSPGKGWQDYSVVGATFSWPIFDGWQTKAKVGQAIADLKMTQLTKEKTTKDIALELKNAYLALKSAVSKIENTKAQVDLYKDAVSVAIGRQKAGIFSFLDLNDGEIAYEVSLFNYKEALYDYAISKAAFEKAIGGM